MMNIRTPRSLLVDGRRLFVAAMGVVALSTGSAQTMVYRENVVRFEVFPQAKRRLVEGIYTVNEHFVTDGQDPSGEIRDGVDHRFTPGNPTMTFRAGRDPSHAAGDWFKQRVPANGHTFGNAPDKLDFALLGRLQLTLTDTSGTARWTDTYTLEDIALAQGAPSDGPNWWFGGKYCTRLKGKGNNWRVQCPATSSSGFAVQLIIKRGDNAVDLFQLDKVTMPSMKTVKLDSAYVGEDTRCNVKDFRCPPYVDYLKTPGEKDGLMLSVLNGELVDAFNTVFDTRDGDRGRDGRPAAIYVVDSKGQLYASIVHMQGLIHHSSLVEGAPVAAAGEFIVSAGRIVSANSCSGHYKPSARLVEVQLREALNRLGYTDSFPFISCGVP